MPATEERVWTSEDVRRLRDEQEDRGTGPRMRFEVVDGELIVTPAPRAPHQEAVMNLGERLRAYAHPRRLGWVVYVAADVEMDPRTNVQPDVLVAPLVNGKRPGDWSELGDLLFVSEVLSPSTARYDRGVKRLRYQRAGIPEYWIVDVDSRVVERWRPEDERPEVLSESIDWHPAGATEPFVLDLPAYFAEVWDETR